MFTTYRVSDEQTRQNRSVKCFEAAYEAANGKKPEITTKPGWYSIDGGKNLRLADVAALTEELTFGKTAEPKAEEAPKAPAKKTKTKTAVPAKEKKHHSLLLKQTMMVTKLKNFGSLT